MSRRVHGRARRRARPSMFARVIRALWRVVRVLLMVGLAFGPPAPPPPPPPPQGTAQQDDDGQEREEL